MLCGGPLAIPRVPHTVAVSVDDTHEGRRKQATPPQDAMGKGGTTDNKAIFDYLKFSAPSKSQVSLPMTGVMYLDEVRSRVKKRHDNYLSDATQTKEYCQNTAHADAPL